MRLPYKHAPSEHSPPLAPCQDLMKGAPELMTEALNLHNAVIRKARWTTFGYVTEQEGDSFTLCFYEAIDAVTFALMVGLGGKRRQRVVFHHSALSHVCLFLKPEPLST